MSTVVTTTPTPKTTSWWVTPETRAAAAKLGWLRRRGLYVPTEHERFAQAIQDADPGLLRLYVCDVAGAVQHHYLARFPGDSRTIEAIAVARRLATGNATERERSSAFATLISRFREMEATRAMRRSPADAALQAAGFTLSKRLEWAARWGLFWSGVADQADRLDYGRHLPVLEALKQR